MTDKNFYIDNDSKLWDKNKTAGTVKKEYKKFDQHKIPLTLLPTKQLEEVAQVLQFGAAKYGKSNWKKGTNYTRLLDATLRHLFAWEQKQDRDPETHLSHLAHAICSLLFLMWYQDNDGGKDDRGI